MQKAPSEESSGGPRNQKNQSMETGVPHARGPSDFAKQPAKITMNIPTFLSKRTASVPPNQLSTVPTNTISLSPSKSPSPLLVGQPQQQSLSINTTTTVTVTPPTSSVAAEAKPVVGGNSTDADATSGSSHQQLPTPLSTVHHQIQRQLLDASATSTTTTLAPNIFSGGPVLSSPGLTTHLIGPQDSSVKPPIISGTAQVASSKTAAASSVVSATLLGTTENFGTSIVFNMDIDDGGKAVANSSVVFSINDESSSSCPARDDQQQGPAKIGNQANINSTPISTVPVSQSLGTLTMASNQKNTFLASTVGNDTLVEPVSAAMRATNLSAISVPAVTVTTISTPVQEVAMTTGVSNTNNTPPSARGRGRGRPRGSVNRITTRKVLTPVSKVKNCGVPSCPNHSQSHRVFSVTLKSSSKWWAILGMRACESGRGASLDICAAHFDSSSFNSDGTIRPDAMPIESSVKKSGNLIYGDSCNIEAIQKSYTGIQIEKIVPAISTEQSSLSNLSTPQVSVSLTTVPSDQNIGIRTVASINDTSCKSPKSPTVVKSALKPANDIAGLPRLSEVDIPLGSNKRPRSSDVANITPDDLNKLIMPTENWSVNAYSKPNSNVSSGKPDELRKVYAISETVLADNSIEIVRKSISVLENMAMKFSIFARDMSKFNLGSAACSVSDIQAVLDSFDFIPVCQGIQKGNKKIDSSNNKMQLHIDNVYRSSTCPILLVDSYYDTNSSNHICVSCRQF